MADLWLVGEMVNRIGIYGSKVAEGLSAFQRRSCYKILTTGSTLSDIFFQKDDIHISVIRQTKDWVYRK